jgi:hypothetical protein
VTGARIAAVVALLAAPLGAAACTGGAPQVELSQAASGGDGRVTVTATVTDVETRTVTTTATVTATRTVAMKPTVTVTLRPRPALTTSPIFDGTKALADFASIVADIRALDAMPLTGNTAATRFELLSRHLLSLGANAAPPGLDPPSYQSRVASLRLFTDAAADEAQAGSPQAAARYGVIRQETGTLLGFVNGALHTSFALPPAPTVMSGTP